MSASITIGGTIDAEIYQDLDLCIAGEDLSTKWDGPIFAPQHRQEGVSLRLFTQEVAWGRFKELEAFCVATGIAFVRWSDAYPGQWDRERVVHRGDGEFHSQVVDGDDVVMIDRLPVEPLATLPRSTPTLTRPMSRARRLFLPAEYTGRAPRPLRALGARDRQRMTRHSSKQEWSANRGDA